MTTVNKVEQIENYLEELYPNPKCELEYSKDYELLLATMLSAQTTDRRVNQVTRVLFRKYPSLEALKDAPREDIEEIIKPIGTYQRKSLYVKEIATIIVDQYGGKTPSDRKILESIVDQYGGKTPSDRKILESLPGVGHKTVNVFLSNIYDVPAIAVDTHVERVSKRLGLAKKDDSVLTVEKKLEKHFDSSVWGRRHHQLVLFGRYHCKSMKPECKHCQLQEICKYFQC